ncbi:MAG: hypothetical protein ACYSSL_07195 [Planctomycetota bacterium]|jgi:hypothetical protein
MKRKIKFGKILIVIFLTCLIWVWADLAKTEEVPFYNGIITIDKSANPNLWASFDDEPAVSLKQIVLKGAASKIAEAERKLRDGSWTLEFFLNAAQEDMAEPGPHVLDVPSFLKKSNEIKQLGLTVVSCDPNTLDVKVVKLVKKSLTLECLDESGTSLRTESIEPPKVEMLAPEDWSGTNLRAYVLLSRVDKEQARLVAITKRPYIKLAPGQTREASVTVKVKLPPTEKGLQKYNVTATIGFVFSANLVGEYGIELLNPSELATVNIKATAAAKKAYEDEPYQMILHILDKDKNITDEQRKKVIYTFPEEFVRSDEIELDQPPAQAKFILTPRPSAEAK